MINIENNDTFQNILISAFRYALGRHTYIVQDTIDFLAEHINDLSTRAIGIMRLDLKRYLKNLNIKQMNSVDKIDYLSWNNFLTILEAKINGKRN